MNNINLLRRQIFILLFFSTNYLISQNPFIQNKGQFSEQIIAKVNLPSGVLFIEKGKSVYSFYSSEQLSQIHNLSSSSKKIDAHAYSMNFINSNTDITSEFLGEGSYFENYFLGASENWAVQVKTFLILYQKNIYSGVDIKYHVENDKLKYDIIVFPEADVDKIKVKYEGADKISLEDGSLYVNTSVNTVKESRPFAYQIINGSQIEVKCNYMLKNNIISFYFPNGYDIKYPLTIDPILEFSTYSGSTADNFGYSATYDNFGFLYSGSTVFGPGYPTTLGAYQLNYANTSGGTDIAITKYGANGTQRIYSTYLGGSLDEIPHSLIVNSDDQLFIYGTTGSEDFPTTPLAYQQNFNGGVGISPSGIGVEFPNGSDIFVSRLSASGGELLASTFLGGSGNDGLNTAPELNYNYADEVRGEIDIDRNNNVYIASCTQSSDFPMLNSLQINSSLNQEGCVIKMDNQLTSIIWSTFLGGSSDDAIYSLAIDENNDIYVTGGTTSRDFPSTQNSFQIDYQDSIKPDAFVSKISSNGSQLLASSFFGTNKYDQSYFVEIGAENNIYLFGQTNSTGNQLIINSDYSVLDGGQFIAVFNEELSGVIRSTVLGSGKGTPDISPTAFLVDICNNIYLSGWGSNLGGQLSTLNLPVTTNAYQQNTDGNDIYMMVINGQLSDIIYATYFGGSQSNEHVDGGTSRFDKKGIIYQAVCAGCGGNSDFPIEPNPGAVSTTNASSNCNNGVFKFNFDLPIVIAEFNAPWVGCDTVITFQNLTSSDTTITYIWNFGDGHSSNEKNPTHTFAQNGIYDITLIANDNSSCNLSDTINKKIYILSNSSFLLDTIVKCPNEQAQIGLPYFSDPNITYFWFPSNDLTSPTSPNPFCDVNFDTQYQLVVSNGSCADTLSQNIIVNNFDLYASEDTFYCNTPIVLEASFSTDVNSIIWSSNNSFTDTLSHYSNLTINGPSTFYIKISDANCSKIDSIKVFSYNININLSASNICLGDSVEASITELNPFFPLISFSWNINNVETFDLVDFPDSSQWYVVQVENSETCIIRDSVFVEVNDYPIIDSLWASDSVFFKGEEITLYIATNDMFNWSDFSNSDFSQEFIAKETTCYTIEVFNNFGCLLTDSVCIQVNDVFCDENNLKIPNAFSPNGDNINDTYFIKDDDGIITNFKLEIFNRLGQKVYASDDIFRSWDGTFMGKKITPQVFDFYLDLECIGDKRLFYKGNITLIR